MALHLPSVSPLTPRPLRSPYPRSPYFTLLFPFQRFADLTDHPEDHTTHARHIPDIPPDASRSDREQPLTTRRPTRISTIPHEGGASCVTPSSATADRHVPRPQPCERERCSRTPASPAPAVSNPQLTATLMRLPLQFEANQGQVEEQVTFLARGTGYTLFLTPSESVLVLQQREPTTNAAQRERGEATGRPELPAIKQAVVG